MPKTVGVTHADLAPSRRSTELGSKTGVAFIVVTIICGLFCFVLCLIAEATRSQEKWVESGEDGKDVKYECIYSGSGKMALLCSAVAFVGLAVVMLVEHMYMFCFAVAEILLLIGLSVESGHLKNWSKPRESCLIIREGLFCAAGVLTLMTVFLAAGLYLTALHAQKLFQQQQLVRQQVLETTVLYTSPPGSPPHRLTTMAREDP
ncbi:hypothetical protein Gotri_004489, partial [Gossypium trilobum]|nr:hypothetical protein [Gossypium trilobum]